MRRTLITLASLLTTSIAFAHEGHGTPGEGTTAVHYFTEPLHVGGLIVAAIACVFIARVVWRRSTPAAVRADKSRSSVE